MPLLSYIIEKGGESCIVSLLLQQGKRVNLGAPGGPNNNTPLHLAIMSGLQGIALSIIERARKDQPAVLIQENKSGDTPL